MKIGIITMPLRFNYGGILQAYALQTILERMGHDVFVVRKDEKRHMRRWLWPIQLLWRMSKRVCGSHTPIFIERNANRKFDYITKFTWPFINKYIQSYLVPSKFIVPQGVFDCLIVGSDQVWRKRYIQGAEHSPIQRLFLDYTEGWNIKRIVYAASFGTDKWELNEEETIACRKLIKQFNGVSVREESGQLLCRENLHIEAKWVIDPTLLLEQTDYIRLIGQIHTEKHETPTVVSYILDPTEEKEKLHNTISEFMGCKPYKLKGDPWFIKNFKDKQLPAIEDWLNAFYTANFVFTDSFHGTVFSIIFNKPFAVYRNEERGSTRMESLLKLFNLENRLISSIDDFYHVSKQTIDWSKVNKIKKQKQGEALHFLKTALEDNGN